MSMDSLCHRVVDQFVVVHLYCLTCFSDISFLPYQKFHTMDLFFFRDTPSDLLLPPFQEIFSVVHSLYHDRITVHPSNILRHTLTQDGR